MSKQTRPSPSQIPKTKRVRRGPRLTIDSILKKLKLIDDEMDPDVVVIIRLRATDEGGWELQWDGGHWLIFDKDFQLPKDQLPPGVAERIVKAFAYETAKSTGGDFLASMGASFGKAAVDKVAELLPHIKRKA